MFSSFECNVPPIVATGDSLVAASQEFHAVTWFFSTIDWVILGIGTLLAFVILVRLIRRGRLDPLAAAPIRVNEFREDSLALAVLAYLVAALLLGGVFQLIYGEKDGVMKNLFAGSGAQLAGASMCLVIASPSSRGSTKRSIRGSQIGSANFYRRCRNWRFRNVISPQSPESSSRRPRVSLASRVSLLLASDDRSSAS